MKARNVLKGRHYAGTPVGGNRTQPPSRTGSASGNFVGTGVNRKTAAKPQYGTSQSSGNVLSGRAQAEQYTKQSPEPFRNPAFGAVPTVPATQQSGGPNKAYQPYAGSRVSVPDGDTTNLGGKPSAVGIKGSYGMGRENGKVAGPKQPRRAGNPKNQPKATFYGR